MVSINYMPADKLVIHEVVEVSREDLLRERVTPAGTIPLYWSNGIIFSFSSLPMTDEVVKDYLKGTIHWLEVHFAKMEEFEPVLSISDEEYKGTMSVRIIDTSGSQLHKEFTKWLKTTTSKK